MSPVCLITVVFCVILTDHELGKKACIAYIALLPLYNPNVVDAKVRETGFHNYQDLLKWHLKDDMDLRTKYNRTTGDGRESFVVDAPAEISDEKAAKGDNTSSTELQDRWTMIKELIRVAERVDAVRKGEIGKTLCFHDQEHVLSKCR